MSESATPSIGQFFEIEDTYLPRGFARQPIETANLISLAVEQLTHPDKIPLTRISATPVGKLLDALSTPLLLIDHSLRIAFANRACEKVSTDYESNVGCPVTGIFPHESTGKGFGFLIQKVFVNQMPLIVEAPVCVGSAKIAGRLHLRVLRFGTKRAILIIIEDLTHEPRPVRSSRHRAKSVLRSRAAFKQLHDLLVREIGGREKSEQALQRTHDKFGQLHEGAAQTTLIHESPRNDTLDAIVICDMRGHALYVNSSFTRVIGWTAPEIRGQEMAYVKESGNEITVSQMLEWIANSGQREQLPAKCYSKAHAPIAVGLSGIRSAELMDRPGGLPVFVRNLMRHKTAEEAARRNEEAVKELLNTAGDAVGLVDTEGFVLGSNAIFAERMGLTVEQCVGMNLLEFFPEPLAHERRERGRQAMKTGRPVRFSDERAGRCLDNTVCPLFDYEGRVERLVFVSRDVTDQVRTREELRRAREEAEVAKRAKTEFLANVSHELRTPLNSIIGFSEILEDQLFGELNEKQLAHVGHVLSSGRQLLQLIDNILDLANLEIGPDGAADRRS